MVIVYQGYRRGAMGWKKERLYKGYSEPFCSAGIPFSEKPFRIKDKNTVEVIKKPCRQYTLNTCLKLCPSCNS
jgi:hypothetical protein